MRRRTLLGTLAGAALYAAAPRAIAAPGPAARVRPGDPGWPSEAA
jgi:ABC-type proline/glycine betaine transport system substrate-binding protein